MKRTRSKEILYEKEIILSNKSFLDNFGIELKNPKYESKHKCNVKGPFNPSVHMQDVYGMDYGVVTTFYDMLYVENNTLCSKFKDPIICKVMKNINNLLSIFNACRFRSLIDGKYVLSTLLSRIYAVISFTHLTKEDKFLISIELRIPSFKDNGDTNPMAQLITKETSLDQFHFIQLVFNYNGQGDFLSSDFYSYREKIFEIWKINESATHDDYKKLGLLTDMLNI